MIDTTSWPKPPGGWPSWVFDAPYVAAAHPQSLQQPLTEGANCQRYAYGVLALFGLVVSNHRSSELWAAPSFIHPAVESARDLDLALFNSDASSAWGAHVAIILGGPAASPQRRGRQAGGLELDGLRPAAPVPCGHWAGPLPADDIDTFAMFVLTPITRLGKKSVGDHRRPALRHSRSR